MTPKDKSLAIDLLDDAEEALYTCLDGLRRLELHVKKNGMQTLADHIRDYTIVNLSQFLGSELETEHRIGSMSDIRADLRYCNTD